MANKIKKLKKLSLWAEIYGNLVNQGLLESESGDGFIFYNRGIKYSSATLSALAEHCDLIVEPLSAIRVFVKEPKLLDRRIRCNWNTFFGEISRWESRILRQNFGFIFDVKYKSKDTFEYSRFTYATYDDYILDRNYVCYVMFNDDYFWMDRVI